MAYFSKDFIQFFKELAANNHKEWFDLNRKRYEKEVKDPFKIFIEEMIRQVAKDDPAVKLEPKDAIFRINRDIRFSKDKTPYKTQVSAVIAAGGKKDHTTPGMYLELTPEHVRVYGGVYVTDKEQLYNLRSYIINHMKEFNSILNEKKFKDMFGEVRGEQNKIIPKEFREAAEKQPLILNKQFYYFGQLKPNVVLDDDLPEQLMKYYTASKPIKKFLTAALKD